MIDNSQPQISSASSEKPPRISVDKNPLIIIDEPIPEIPRKLSTESFPMSIDEDKHDSDHESDNRREPFKLVLDDAVASSPLPNPQSLINKVGGPYLTSEEFNYTMKIMDDKINALYKLCRYIGQQQEQTTNLLKKLVAHDELSEQFWSVSYLVYLDIYFNFNN